MCGGGIAMRIGGEIAGYVFNQFTTTGSQSFRQQYGRQIRAAAAQGNDCVGRVSRKKSWDDGDRVFCQDAAKPPRMQPDSSCFMASIRYRKASFVNI